MALNDADRELMDLQRSLSASGAGIAGLPSGAAVAADPAVIRTWELRRAAQQEAYGQYVADGDIYLGNALTFTNAQAVPLEHVIRFQLEERGQVNRVATPELARLGKRFETDQEFLAANPRLTKRRTLAVAGELHPSALDPRGGAAEIDEARKRGETVDAPSYPGDESPTRREAAAEQAEQIAATPLGRDDDEGDDAGTPKAAGAKASGAKTRASRSSGSDKKED